MIKCKTVIVCVGILLSLQSYSQFIPLGTLPMLYNGGFAGEGDKARVVAGAGVGSYMNLSNDRDNKAFSYFGSYDQFIPKLHTGIGLTFNRGNYNYRYWNDAKYYDKNRTFLMLSLSPKFSAKGKYTFAPFVNVSYSAIENTRPDAFRSRDTGIETGFLFNSRKFYGGVNFYVFRTNDQIDVHPFENSHNYAWAVQMGYTFQKLPESDFSFTPQVAFFIDRKSYSSSLLSVDLNLMFRYKKFITSLNNNGIGVGLQNKNVRVLLSQNYIFFSNANWKGSLSLRYIFK